MGRGYEETGKKVKGESVIIRLKIFTLREGSGKLGVEWFGIWARASFTRTTLKKLLSCDLDHVAVIFLLFFPLSPLENDCFSCINWNSKTISSIIIVSFCNIYIYIYIYIYNFFLILRYGFFLSVKFLQLSE